MPVDAPFDSPIALWFAWLSGATLHAVVGGLLATGRTRPLALLWGTLGLGLPFFCPEGPAVLKALSCLLFFWLGWVRVAELAIDARYVPPLERLWRVTAIFDPRRVRYGQPSISWLLAGECAIGALLGTGFGFVALAAPTDGGFGAHLFRYAAGVAFVYFSVSGALAFVPLVYGLFGIFPPRLHDHPILARSVAEFWGRRWNRIVGTWLRTRFFHPLAKKRRPILGLFAAFLMSAALHAYFVWVALDPEMALLMGAFFLVQWLFVVAELGLRVRNWPVPLARLWTFSAIVGTSPMFLEPFLRVVGG
jgi:hypothetical protein